MFVDLDLDLDPIATFPFRLGRSESELKDFEGATLIFLVVAGNDNVPVENGPGFNVQKTPKHLGRNYPKTKQQEIITLSLSQYQILSFTSLAHTIILSTPLVSNF